MTDNTLFREKPVECTHTVAKPTGSLCNLNCDYCFYLHKKDLLNHPAKNLKMSDEVLETFIKQYITGQNTPQIVFSWQGGEPTLLGIDFFKKVVSLQKKYTPAGVKIENDLQTNGTLLDEQWCKFLKENNFLVGLSVDGPKDVHDTYRTYNGNKGSFDEVMQGVSLLKKYNVDFAALACVTAESVKDPLKVYSFLRDEVKASRIQFSPVVEFEGFEQNAPKLKKYQYAPPANYWSVSSEGFGDFLIEVFDEWFLKDIGYVFINYFESAVAQWAGMPAQMCTLAPMCGKSTAIEHDGSVYTCDHFVYPEYHLGNIFERELKDMAFSEKQEYFGKMKESMLPDYCRSCEYLFACFGECPRNRVCSTPDNQPGLNYFCKGFKKYFKHIDPVISKIVRELGYEVSKDSFKLSKV